MDNPEETAMTLRTHPDGHTWLHTGDLGVMDEDGFVYFRQRIKRMIVTSGTTSILRSLRTSSTAMKRCCIAAWSA